MDLEGVMAERIILYSVDGCATSEKARHDLVEQGFEVDERKVNSSQQWLDEALQHSAVVPVIIWPDGRVEVGWKGEMG